MKENRSFRGNVRFVTILDLIKLIEYQKLLLTCVPINYSFNLIKVP